MLTVVLIEPEIQGNIGAIARVMANFGLNDLVIINPKCEIGNEAIARAKHAKSLLKKAKIKDFSYLKKFDYLIATTAVIGTDYNIPRSPLSPEQLAEKLKSRGKIAILFGREGTGLRNKEILKCDFVVTIPSYKKYRTLNISHAASIIFYELFKKSKKQKSTSHIVFASKIEKDIILKKINEILDKLPFATKDKKQTQKIVWKRIIGKSFLTKREAFAVLGFLRKLGKKL